MTEMSYNPLKSSLKALSYGSSAKNQFNPGDLLLYSIFASLKNKDVNGNKQLPRVYVLPLHCVREASCIAGQAPKRSSWQIRKRTFITAMETRAECTRIQWHAGTLLPLHELHVNVQKTKGRLKKYPQNPHKQNCSRERCPSTLFPSATMPGFYKPVLWIWYLALSWFALGSHTDPKLG